MLRYQAKNVTEPLQKGPKTKIPDALYKSLDYHTSMLQICKKYMFSFTFSTSHMIFVL